ncbi:MAG: nicotinic acid mononucleotide adenyltransferase [Polaribacter sp.]|nr:nicotinic acid mononucleotide adenyltransferase [Polaribacter sp.]MDG1810386.1 nicotinic acid mononucleotide adenyltransferase [Polaribacter sp.]MDG1994755.1 nicotinic acid mononucleotide adenyltransferase [Polaribacter sp.]
MKKIIALLLLLTVTISNAQKDSVTFEKSEDMVKATYYYQDGSIKEQGFFKDKKLTGQWVSFNKQGEKTMLANYKEGKKVGKWFVWDKKLLKEINYVDNKLVAVKNWSEHARLASNK